MNYRLAAVLTALLAWPLSGYAAPPPAARPAQVIAGPSLIDVNSADEKTLDTLPGVGQARVKAIIANRPYAEKQELVDKKVLPANVLASIQDKIALINVNMATAAAMVKILPNVGPVRAQQIVDKRPYATLQDLVTKGALTQGIFDGIKGLITTGS